MDKICAECEGSGLTLPDNMMMLFGGTRRKCEACDGSGEVQTTPNAVEMSTEDELAQIIAESTEDNRRINVLIAAANRQAWELVIAELKTALDLCRPNKGYCSCDHANNRIAHYEKMIGGESDQRV